MSEPEEPDDYLDKSPSASRMGKAVEYLVDDEGVDLVFNRRGSSATLAVQVKARMSDSKRVRWAVGLVLAVEDPR
jgi:hypothetical protein